MSTNTPSEKKKKERPEPKNWAHKLWLDWIKPIGLAILVVFAFRSSFIDWNDVPSASMEPTILVGDRIFVNKLAYDLKFPFTRWRIFSWDDPDRGDIVVFFAPQDGRRMVKRVLGVPGDSFEVRGNVVFINGQALEFEAVNSGKFSRLDLEDLGRAPIEFENEITGDVMHPVMFLNGRGGSRYADFGPITIPEAQFLMMGDNRNNSRDSRDPTLGLIPRDLIVGRAFGVAFSFDRKPSFRVRWERLLRSFGQEDPPSSSTSGDSSDHPMP
ncbi:MAG: signal peptidase I [Phycisphaerales bacterium]